jgi:nickel-dependent lactate racemase
MLRIVYLIESGFCMEYLLNYHKGLKLIKIPEKANVTVLQPEAMPVRETLADMTDHALHNARFIAQLRKRNPSRIAIVIPDETQPVPVETLLPNITQQLFQALPHMEPTSVTIIIGNGLQPPPNRDMIDKILSSTMVRRCNVVVHVPDDARMKDFGMTRRGTPVRINAALGEADFKVVIGLIEPHQYVGFTGGAKEAVIGCGSAETIRQNHRLIQERPTHRRHVDGHPMREDIDEAGRRIGIDFAVNVVLNTDEQVVRVFAGAPNAVLEQGAETCAAVYGLELEKKFDIVLASCAGHPKDISAYQAQKSFSLVSHAVKEGGKILLLVAFRKGFGGDVYFDYVCPSAEPEAVMQDFTNFGYAMGAPKADVFGSMRVNDRAGDFSDVDSEIMRNCHLRAADPSSIMGEWVDDFKGTPEVAVIPLAATTFFYNGDRQLRASSSPA